MKCVRGEAMLEGGVEVIDTWERKINANVNQLDLFIKSTQYRAFEVSTMVLRSNADLLGRAMIVALSSPRC